MKSSRALPAEVRHTGYGLGTGTAVLVLLLMLLAPQRVEAHQRLLRSEPAKGAVLHTAPGEIRLTFNEAVEPSVARIELIGPDGRTVVLGPPASVPDSATVLRAPIGGPLRVGEYTVRWAGAGRDGHPVRGEYTFSIAEGANGLAAEPAGEPAGAVTAPGHAAPPAAHHPTVGDAGETAFGADSAGYILVRWATFIALLGVIGAAAFRLLVLGALGRRGAPDDATLLVTARRGAATAGLAFVALLIIATLARLYAQSLAMHGSEAVLATERIGGMLTHTVWGWGWLVQAGAALAAGIGFAVARRGQRGGWLLAGVAALALAATPALSGHAVATSGPLVSVAIISDWLHVLAAGGWLGSLLVLLAAGIPATYGLGPVRRGAAVGALVRAFSPTALFFVGVLVLSGVVSTIIHSGSLAELLGSRYGVLLLVKVAIFLLVLGTGAYNLLRVQPALGDDVGTLRLRRSARFELAVGAVVLLVTAMLVATALPEESAPRTGANALTTTGAE